MIAARNCQQRAPARTCPRQAAAVALFLAACIAALCVAGCRQGPAAAEAPAAETKDKGAPEAEGVTLKPE